MKPIVIIGSGHAGLTVAREIRQLDDEVEIIVISKERVCSYYKPNLSKALFSNKSPDQLVMKTAEKLEDDLNIITMSNTDVVKICSEKSEIDVVDSLGTRNIKYKDLILATGANPITLPIVGNAKEEVISINTLEDYRTFRERVGKKSKVLIIGAGFVGCELASDLSSSGHYVDVADLSEWPMQRMLPKGMGRAVAQSLSEKTSRWHLNTSVVKVTHTDEGIDVEFSNGKNILVDVVVSAVGLVPNCELAFDSGIKVSKGIAVDSFLRTNIKNIYALGDCAEINGHNLPFISPATLSAKCLAKTLTGIHTPLVLPSFEVAVKINSFPLVVSPALNNSGEWNTEGDEKGSVGRYVSDNGTLLGFALSGEKVSMKNELVKEYIASNSANK
ncbi:MAG: FAD-dependent oxidoreductase [Pseudomonadales bacterium]|nr:FAD-dependent oxidoreductase [Pseudomonadales bacterium]